MIRPFLSVVLLFAVTVDAYACDHCLLPAANVHVEPLEYAPPPELSLIDEVGLELRREVLDVDELADLEAIAEEHDAEARLVLRLYGE
jgi:hypothetical protein